MMLTDNLLESILLSPALDGANRLYIVSGYATPAMAFNHFQVLKERNREIQLDLILGMCAQDGLLISNHRGFQNLVTERYPERIRCSYLFGSSPVHSKVYAWFTDELPMRGYI